jgi:hypothetical protein
VQVPPCEMKLKRHHGSLLSCLFFCPLSIEVFNVLARRIRCRWASSLEELLELLKVPSSMAFVSTLLGTRTASCPLVAHAARVYPLKLPLPLVVLAKTRSQI